MLGNGATRTKQNDDNARTLSREGLVSQAGAKFKWSSNTLATTHYYQVWKDLAARRTYRSGLVCFEVVEKSFGRGPVRLLFN